MPLNKPLLRKVMKRLEAKPETYNQEVYVDDAERYTDRPVPSCGTVACFAGEIIICSERSAVKGVALLREANRRDAARETAMELSGITTGGVFRADASYWPVRFRDQFNAARTYKGQARALINYIKYMLKTESED